ncbi:MAG: hypothetical protein IPG34_11005 [Rhodocyclaceae bacterium]|nr:hypothetical protein [Rhodocyclaceae bacterium]
MICCMVTGPSRWAALGVEVINDPKVPFDPKSPDQVKTEYTWTIKNGDTVGNDTEGGDDSLYGGKGDDWLLGGAGNDLLEGGDDDDVLFGEAGHDTPVLGGAGGDVRHGDSPDITEDKFGNWLDGGWKMTRSSAAKVRTCSSAAPATTFCAAARGATPTSITRAMAKTAFTTKTRTSSRCVRFWGSVSAPKISSCAKGSLLLDFGDGDELHIEEFNADDPLTNPSVASFGFADGGSFTWEELLARGFDLDGIEGDDLLTGTWARRPR